MNLKIVSQKTWNTWNSWEQNYQRKTNSPRSLQQDRNFLMAKGKLWTVEEERQLRQLVTEIL